MVATAELHAAIREALRTEGPETDQAIWNEYFFEPDGGADDESRYLEYERIRAASLASK